VTFLNPLTAYRCHPVCNLLDAVCMGVLAAIPAGIAAFACGFTFNDLLLISGTMNLLFTIGVLGILQHSHFPIGFGPLERVLISPLMHQVHHSVRPEHWNKNYGSRLSIWDWWFGTVVILPKHETVQVGINPIEDRRGAYSSVIWCYVGPIINCCKMLFGRTRAAAPADAGPARP
jgi:sterol desaturase/sphingolipid hydroxylase (fatty acid hydroxylase superfamily)